MAEQESWDAYNELLLNGALDRFTKLFARYELFKKVIDIPGDIVEGGVFKGAGVLFWAKLIQIFNPQSARKVIGFDTFEGFPESTSKIYDKDSGKQFIETSNYQPVSPDSIMDSASKLGLEHRIELIKGDACVTIKHYVKERPGFRVALLNLDFDPYEPTAAALQHLFPRIVPKGIVVLDEYAAHKWGESDAVDEFIRGKGIILKSFPWALSPTAYFQKE